MLEEIILGKRIKLKRPDFDLETAKKIFSIIDKCRDVFLPWLDWVKYTNSPNDTLIFLEKTDDDWNNDSQFVYEINIDDTFIGLISIINIAWTHKRAEIGYWLDTDYTGNGYISEALALIEKELFANDFNRIVIHTDVLNYRSANVAINAGYKLDGVLRQNVYSEPNERYRDKNVFSKLRSDIIKVR